MATMKNDTNTRLLLRFEGNAGESVATDVALGGRPKVITCRGVLSTQQVKYGEKALKCYGVDNNVEIAPSGDFGFGYADWTVDGWFYLLSAPPAIFMWYYDADNYFAVTAKQQVGEWYLGLRHVVNGVVLEQDDNLKTIGLGGWHHVAVTGFQYPATEDYFVFLYVDGVSSGDRLSYEFYQTFNFANWPFYIGRGVRLPGESIVHLHGYVDEFRVAQEQILKPDGSPLAGGGSFDPVTSQYPETVENRVTGGYLIRNPYANVANGRYGIVHSPIENRATGRHTVHNSIVNRANGRHLVRNPMENLANGRHAVSQTSAPQLHTYENRANGRHLVRNSIENRATGRYSVHSMTIENLGTGRHRIDNAIENRATGRHAVHNLIENRPTGHHAVDSTDDRYAVWHAIGSIPDLTGTPLTTSATLPINIPNVTGEGVHYYVIRQRNDLGRWDQNIAVYTVELDDSDDYLVPRPQSPRELAVTATADNSVRVRSVYAGFEDGAAEADTWLIYYTSNGVDPNPDVDTPVEVTMKRATAYTFLDYELSGFSPGQTVKVLVRVKQTDGRSDLNTTIVSTTSTATGPAAPPTRAVQRVNERLVEV